MKKALSCIIKDICRRLDMITKENKAITLIALVVTIILLLILAGVSITMLTGKNGILNKAMEAKEETGKAQIIEQAKTDIMEKQSKNSDSDVKVKKG